MQRDEKIDIIKGIAICCVVFGHCDAPFTHFIYLFHMAAFFIASGFVYKLDYSDSVSGLKNLFRKRVKSLWFPFMGFSTFFLLCWNFWIKLHFYDGNLIAYSLMLKKFLRLLLFLPTGYPSVPMCGALWFLFSLFYIVMIYGIVDFILKRINFPCKRLFHIVFAMIVFLFNYYLIKKGFETKKFTLILGPYIMYALGVEMSRWNLRSVKEKLFYPIFLVSFFILLLCDGYGSIDIARRLFTSPYFFIVVSISGWFFLYSLAYFFEKISFLKKIFIYLGQNTMCIIGFHIFAFKLVSFLQVKIYSLPIQSLTKTPYLIASSGWWLCYFVVSISFCLLLNSVYKKILLVVSRVFRKNSLFQHQI